jgi:hypothetical protein
MFGRPRKKNLGSFCQNCLCGLKIFPAMPWAAPQHECHRPSLRVLAIDKPQPSNDKHVNPTTNSKMIVYNFKVFHAIERTVRSLGMTARAS